MDVAAVPGLLERIRASGQVRLGGVRAVPFCEAEHLVFHRRETLPFHANGMRFTAFDGSGGEVDSRCYYSVGGGFVVTEQGLVPDATELPYPFHSADELLRRTQALGGTIAELMRCNERHWRSDVEIDAGLLKIWRVMQACVERGCVTDGVLPGGFKVRRRAAALYRQLTAYRESMLGDPMQVMG